MSFWGSVGNMAKSAGNKVIEAGRESKEIQASEMAYKSDEELRRLLNCSPLARQMAANREFKDRGLSK